MCLFILNTARYNRPTVNGGSVISPNSIQGSRIWPENALVISACSREGDTNGTRGSFRIYADFPDRRPGTVMSAVCDISWDSPLIETNRFKVMNVGSDGKEGAQGWYVRSTSRSDGDGALGTIHVEVMQVG